MDFYDVLKKRRSIRSYKNDPVPEESIQRIAEAVYFAPSACNMKPWKIKLVTDPGLRAQIAANYTQPWLAEAPAIAVIIGNNKQCWQRFEGNPAVDIDVGIAMEHLVLAATAEGLATCWICAYEIKKMNAVLKVKDPWNVLAISPLGYANAAPKDVPHKDINKIFEVI
ncbi:MAG: nitroreductase family protein [Victivallaceae bacterium]|nr:nitroreductase family protein [Victivallaceae bacterium]